MGEADEFGHVCHVDGGVEFFSEGGEHGGDCASGKCAPKEVDTFQVLSVGDDEQVAGLDAELGEGVGCGRNGRFEFPPRHMYIWLICSHIDDGVLAVIIGSEGDGIEQTVKLVAGLLSEQVYNSFKDFVYRLYVFG